MKFTPESNGNINSKRSDVKSLICTTQREYDTLIAVNGINASPCRPEQRAFHLMRGISITIVRTRFLRSRRTAPTLTY